jgi:hypothetical protein
MMFQISNNSHLLQQTTGPNLKHELLKAKVSMLRTTFHISYILALKGTCPLAHFIIKCSMLRDLVSTAELLAPILGSFLQECVAGGRCLVIDL